MANLPSYDELMKDKKEEKPSKDLPSYDELMSSNNSEPKQLSDVVGNIPIIGGPAQFALENREAINKGILEGITGGFSGEIEGALKGAGKTALEAAQGDIPEQESAIDRLKANYEKYKQLADLSRTQAEEKNLVSPILSGAGKMAGLAAMSGPALAAAAPAGVLARVGTMTGLGAITGAGESQGSLSQNPDKLLQDIKSGAKLGAIGGVAGEALAPVLGKLAEKGIQYGQKNEYLKQLAATIKNASEGGSLFNQPGKQAIAQKVDEFSSKSAQDIVKNLSEKNKLYEQAFKEASESGAKVQPSTNILDSYNSFLNQMDNSSIKVPNDLKEGFVRLQQGDLDPQESYTLIRKLNDLKFNKTNPKTPEFETINNLVGDLTGATNETLPSNTLQQLNLEKQTAHQAVEPFIQKAGEARFNPQEFTKGSSDFSQNELRSKIKTYFDDLSNRVGEGTAQGTELQNQLKHGIDYFKGLEKQAPLSTNFAKIAEDAQNLGYLNTARRVTSGINAKTGEQTTGGLSSLATKIVSSPFKAAEYVSGSKNAQAVSDALLAGDKEMLGIASSKLSENPATAHLGKMLASPQNQSTLNQTVFTIMQNPTAKNILGIVPEEK